MKRLYILGLVFSSISVLTTACAQGFINLDFEQAQVPATPVGAYGSFVDPARAFPGWAVVSNVFSYPTVTGYNTLSLGSAAIILMGPSFPNGPGYRPLQGNYSVLLQYFGLANPPALTQTGMIPAGTQTISILGNAIIEINGVSIPLDLPSPPGRATGNVSAFAGQTVQLTITANGQSYFDDIRFSSVPEPGVLSLTLLGILCFRRLTQRREKPRQPTPRERFIRAGIPSARRGRLGGSTMR
jgi:hypothetical protein